MIIPTKKQAMTRELLPDRTGLFYQMEELRLSPTELMTLRDSSQMLLTKEKRSLITDLFTSQLIIQLLTNPITRQKVTLIIRNILIQNSPSNFKHVNNYIQR